MKTFKECVSYLLNKEALKKQVDAGQMSEIVKILINDKKFLLNLLWLSLKKSES